MKNFSLLAECKQSYDVKYTSHGSLQTAFFSSKLHAACLYVRE